MYSGLVTYNCDKYQEDRLAWWDAVDVISSSGYYPIDRWEQRARPHRARGRGIRQAVLLHGGRLPHRDGSPDRPNDWALPGAPSGDEQLRYYEAMFAACDARPWVRRASCCGTGRARLYSVEDAAANDDYCPYGKPAGAFLREQYAAWRAEARDDRAGVLAIDAGQTGIKVRLRGARTTSMSLPRHPHARAAAAAARRGRTRGASSRPAPQRVGRDRGRLGAHRPRERMPPAFLARIDDPAVREVILAHDSTTSFLGALGDTRGAVVAAGHRRRDPRRRRGARGPRRRVGLPHGRRRQRLLDRARSARRRDARVRRPRPRDRGCAPSPRSAGPTSGRRTSTCSPPTTA